MAMMNLEDNGEELRRSEQELQKVHAANLARSSGPHFGYETYASLTGAQVAALLRELRDLREKKEMLRATVRRLAPTTCYWEDQKRMFPDGDYVRCTVRWPSDDSEWCPACVAERALAGGP